MLGFVSVVYGKSGRRGLWLAICAVFRLKSSWQGSAMGCGASAVRDPARLLNPTAEPEAEHAPGSDSEYSFMSDQVFAVGNCESRLREGAFELCIHLCTEATCEAA